MPDEVSQINAETRLRRSEDILFSEIDQDKVMIDIQRGDYFGLNPVAGEIWNMLATPHTPEDIIGILLKTYQVDEKTCRTETMEVLQRMVELKLVEIVA